MFKPGDIVKCLNSNHDNSLVKNKNYTVRYSHVKFNDLILLDETNGYYYHINRFVLDVKQTRKLKLKKLCF